MGKSWSHQTSPGLVSSPSAEQCRMRQEGTYHASLISPPPAIHPQRSSLLPSHSASAHWIFLHGDPVYSPPRLSPPGPLHLGPGHQAQLFSAIWAQWVFLRIGVGGRAGESGRPGQAPRAQGDVEGELTNLSSYSGPSRRPVLGHRSAGSSFYTSWSGSELSMLVTRATLRGRGGRHQGRDIRGRRPRECRQRQRTARRQKREREKKGEARQRDQRDRDRRVGVWRGQERSRG